jgi:hypothetical protein
MNLQLTFLFNLPVRLIPIPADQLLLPATRARRFAKNLQLLLGCNK